MCEPTTALAVGAGVSAIGGGMGAIANHQQGIAAYRGQRAMTKLRNQQAMTDWAYRKQLRDREWNQALKIYDVKKQQHNLQVQENTDSLYRAYKDSQIQLNNMIEGTKQQNFDAWRRLLGTQGVNKAAGKIGRRAGQMDRLSRMEYGIESQRRLSDLTRFGQGLNDNMDVLTKQANNANMRSWYGVSIAPQQTPDIPMPLLEPHTAVRPSTLGLIGSLTETVGSAAMSASGLMEAAGAKASIPGTDIPPVNTGQFDMNTAGFDIGSFANPSLNKLKLQFNI